jgi:hypothetical protein
MKQFIEDFRWHRRNLAIEDGEPQGYIAFLKKPMQSSGGYKEIGVVWIEIYNDEYITLHTDSWKKKIKATKLFNHIRKEVGDERFAREINMYELGI